MTTETTTVTPLATYRNERPYPFCPGCGHGPILDQLNRALVELEVDPRRVVLVSDIGCSGLSDQHFVTSAFHGLHGRSITYASGIKLARPELLVIVLMGDGGAGIGGAHLLAAARRNLGVKVLVFNNLNFGMTGGQHSPTTPTGAVTATTPHGSLETPLDLCATVAVNGAAYVWRGTSFDRDLAQRIGEALDHPGFALLDVWDLCSAYFLPHNRWSRKSLTQTMESLGFGRGLIQQTDVEDFIARYRSQSQESPGLAVLPRQLLEPLGQPSFVGRRSLVVAGSAGGRVGSAARLVARAGVLAGLHAAVRSEYPVTVRSGPSLAELVLSREPIDYAGVELPDALVIVGGEGRARCDEYLKRMSASSRLFVERGQTVKGCRARVVELDLSPAHPLRESAQALVSLTAVVAGRSWIPPAALEAAVELEPETRRAGLRPALAAGLELVRQVERST